MWNLKDQAIYFNDDRILDESFYRQFEQWMVQLWRNGNKQGIVFSRGDWWWEEEIEIQIDNDLNLSIWKLCSYPGIEGPRNPAYSCKVKLDEPIQLRNIEWFFQGYNLNMSYKES